MLRSSNHFNRFHLYSVDAARAADVPVLPEECRDYLRNIYNVNTEMLNLLFPSLKAHSRLAHPVDICFTDIIPVTPINTRPVSQWKFLVGYADY